MKEHAGHTMLPVSTPHAPVEGTSRLRIAGMIRPGLLLDRVGASRVADGVTART